MGDSQNNQDELKGVLKEIVLGQVRKLHKSAERTGENFNFFSFLNMERNEVKHSAIIAELLSPNGSHSQRTLFLKLFLKQLQATILNSSSESSGRLRSFLERLKPTIDASNELTGFVVRTEEYVPELKKQEKGFLDIVIESDDAYIVIENKIDTVDAVGQLRKYCEHIETIEKQTKALLYLTPEGEGPKNYKHKHPSYISFEQLSYCADIVAWLDSCITKISGPPRILETLHQYQMIVRKLTGQLPPEVEDILNGLGGKNDILKDGIIKVVQHELQCEFWKGLREQLADKNPKFQLYNDMGQDEKTLDDAGLEKSICHPSLGLTFSILDNLPTDKEHEVAFRVYYERPRDGRQKKSYFNYGFVLCRKDTLQIVEPEDENALKQYVMLEKWSFQYGWISWKYFPYEPGNFITESKETLIRKLISEINLALSKAKKGNKE